nr:didemethylasterriquinone d synthetase tdia [Quercus suber]
MALKNHIFDILKSAAALDSDIGVSFLEKGFDAEPTYLSYQDLYQQAQERGTLLAKTGVVKQGLITIIYFDNHRDNVTWFWSVMAAGGVCAILNPVSNDPRTTAGQLNNLKHLFGSTRVLTTHKLAATFTTHGLAVQTVEQIEKIDRCCQETAQIRDDQIPREDGTAVILFTSGSTGNSKAVSYTHAQLLASVRAKVDYLAFDHSASFCEVHLQAIYAAGPQVFVPASELMVEPHRFLRLLGRFQVGYTFAPNFFLAALVRSMDSQLPTSCADIDLRHLSVLMCGGEANRTGTLDKADKLLRRYGAPEFSIKAAYGLSETCSACFYNLETPSYDMENQNTFASVGKPLPDVVEMRIGDGHEPQAQGLVYLRGEVIFQNYHNDETATSGCMSDDGWMNTGDIGHIDPKGNLHLLGRAKEVLILNGQNYSSFDIEHAVESSNIAGVTTSYTAAFSTWDHDKDSEAVVVLFNPTEAAIGPKNLLKTVQAIEKGVFAVCAQKPKRIVPLPKDLMPKSTIGKLSRAKLKQQFEAGAFDDYLLEQHALLPKAQKCLDDLTPLQQEIARIYASVVNTTPEQLLTHDVLLESGINSMGFMRLKTALEKGIKIHQEIPMPLLTRCHTIAELEHELVKLGTVSQEYNPINVLASQGSKQPIFLLHPGAGEFLCWIGLLEYLTDRPVYAIRAKGLHPGEGVFGGLEEMLDCYYTWIRRTQPKGPYAMLGYCFGGLLGFELSKKFEAAVPFERRVCIRSREFLVDWRKCLIAIIPGYDALNPRVLTLCWATASVVYWALSFRRSSRRQVRRWCFVGQLITLHR